MLNKKMLESIKIKYQSLSPYLDEHSRRIWAATEAYSLGHGGITQIAIITGLSRTTIHAGLKELKLPNNGKKSQGVRQPGGGRKKITETDPTLIQTLESLLESTTSGDPESPLLWTCKSLTNLTIELQEKGHSVSRRTVGSLLSQLGYSLQANRKTKEGSNHPDRDAQFLHISKTVKSFQLKNQPVISVDSKKKELIGEFKNNGKEWHKKSQSPKVNVYDFVDPQLGKIAPYGVYDMFANTGWVNVGISHDTAEFAVESIRRWWYEMGKYLYKHATDLLITADCGGSNGYRVRLWKFELQKLANELGLIIQVCHFPPGTRSLHKIEHRMFCYISQNWRGKPLSSRQVVVNLISNTKNRKGLTIQARLDENEYHTGIKITDADFRLITIEKNDFHGEWNYKILPKSS